MNAAIQASGLRKRWFLIGTTYSQNSAWAFDRLRLYYPKWFTKFGLFSYDDFWNNSKILDDGRATTNKQEPTYGQQLFTSDLAFEHDFTFDLSFNVASNVILICIYGIPPASAFQQIYCYPTGYSASRNKNSEIYDWDFSIVNTKANVGGVDTSIRFNNQPLEILRWYNNNTTPALYAKSLIFNNCRLNGSQKTRLLMWADAGGTLNGTLNYSASFFTEPPFDYTWANWNNLKSKGWVIIGEDPAGVNPNP